MSPAVPKPLPREKKPRKRLQSHTRLVAKTPMKKVNKKRLDKRTKQYKAYMASAEWKGRRLTALVAADYTCQRCRLPMALEATHRPEKMRDIVYSALLHVHHKTYARFGNERVDDLEVLCESCHNAEHAGRLIKPRMLRAG